MRLTPATPIPKLVAQAARDLHASFQRKPTVTAIAPGRVNLIGEHIDYCDGFVLPFAIDRYIAIAASPNGLDTVRIGSGTDTFVSIPVGQAVERGTPGWTNYVRGVVRGFQDRGVAVAGFDAWIASSVPMGAGLSSSAALECCVATLIEGLAGITLPKADRATLCQQAEHRFAGVPCGIMDQFASTFGEQDNLVLIDCRSKTHTLVPFSDCSLTVLVANTMVDHALSDGEYANRRKHTESGLALLGKSSWRDVQLIDIEAQWATLGDPINRRCRHVVTEISRTIDAAAALRKNMPQDLGPLMASSHQSLRDDFDVSCKELDTMVEIAEEIGSAGGVIGSRMTGGGFGGSTVTLCRSEYAETIAMTLYSRYKQQTNIVPEIFASRPAAGARQIRIS